MLSFDDGSEQEERWSTAVREHVNGLVLDLRAGTGSRTYQTVSSNCSEMAGGCVLDLLVAGGLKGSAGAGCRFGVRNGQWSYPTRPVGRLGVFKRCWFWGVSLCFVEAWFGVTTLDASIIACLLNF